MHGITVLQFVEYSVNTDEYITIKRVRDYTGAVPRVGDVVYITDKDTYYLIRKIGWTACSNDTRGPACSVFVNQLKE